MAEVQGRALDWDEPSATAEGGGSVLLSPGVCQFEVTKMERTRYPGGPKIGACPRAKLTLRLIGTDAQTGAPAQSYTTYNLDLWDTIMWKVGQFFRAIGNGTDASGATLVTWDSVVGRFGWCRVGHREYTYNGERRVANEVEEMLDPARLPADAAQPAAQPQPAAPAWQPPPYQACAQPQPQPQGQAYQASPAQQAFISQQFAAAQAAQGQGRSF